MKIVNQTEFDAILSQKGIVLVDFFATWCGPCKMIAPVLEELQEEYPNVSMVKVDVDQEGELARRYSVMSIPTLFLFKDGEVVTSVMGFQPKPALKAMIDKVL